MLFKAGKSTLEQHTEMIYTLTERDASLRDIVCKSSEMIYALTRQINAQQVMMGKMARAMIEFTDAPTSGDIEVMRSSTKRLKEVLAEIAAAGGE